MSFHPAVLLALVLSLLLSGCESRMPPDPADAVASVMPSMVAIEGEIDGARRTLGAGAVWRDDGHIITGIGPATAAETLTVRSAEGRRFPAALVGVDVLSGLALIKAEGDRFSALPAAAVSATRAGDSVLAIGAPDGLTFSVRRGGISAASRSIAPDRLETFLQLDLLARPDFDGSPVLNLDGAVIAVLVRPLNWPHARHHFPLAVPFDRAAALAQQLLDSGRVSRGWLGVELEGRHRTSGQGEMAIRRVLPTSPAAEFGLRPGDVVVSVDGTSEITAETLNAVIARRGPGEVVSLGLIRDGRAVQISVELAAAPAPAGPASALDPLDGGSVALDAAVDAGSAAPEPPPVAPPAREGPDVLGLQVAALSSDQRGSIPLLSGGVRVTRVVDGPALKAGVRVDDLLLQLNGQTVSSPERYAEVVRRLTPGASVPALLQRRGAPQFVTFDLGRAP